jgi:HK97 family phage prohead protease
VSEILYAAFAEPVEIRASGDGRTVEGLVVPYDTPTRRGALGPSRREQFAAGALTRTVAERGNRVTLHAGHPPRVQPDAQVVGRAVEYRDSAAGMRASFRVSQTPLGMEWLELVRDGVVPGFSVGFVELPGRWRDDRQGDGTTLRTQLEVKLRHVALTTVPAYDEALVEAVRAEAQSRSGALSLSEARRRLALL